MNLVEDDDDDIEERSVHEDGPAGYELPPPMTESEPEEDDDDIPILAASEFDEEAQATQSLFGYYPISMLI